MSEFDDKNEEVKEEISDVTETESEADTETVPDTKPEETESETNSGTVGNTETDAADRNEEQTNNATDRGFLNRVEIENDVPDPDMPSYSKGVKIFAVVLALAIIISGSLVAGYFKGKSDSHTNADVYVGLESIPKDKDAKTEAQVYGDVNKSIVGISVYNAAGNIANASGVIYSKEGYIVTNDHIYSEVPAPKFMVYFYDGSERTATYVAGDTVSDLAVLKLDNAAGLTPAVFGNSKEIYCGQKVVAVGRPSSASDASSITSGIVSLPKRRVKTTSNYTANLIQTDSAINPGSSGGALVNMYSQVIGITSSKLAGVEYDAIGFAIPTTTVKRVAEQLIKSGKVTDRAKLGITYTEVDSVVAQINNFSSTGLSVVSVSNDSDLYSKVVKGDLITHVNGTEIKNDDVILDVIEESKAGDKLTLTVLSSSGISKDYTVTLKANIGESSYTLTPKQQTAPDNSGEGSSSEFNFPFGE